MLNKMKFLFPFGLGLQTTPLIITRNYAARKGTRERKAKMKVKVEVEKVGFIPHNLRNKEKMLLNRPKRKFDDSFLTTPSDDVYIAKYYRWKVYSFLDALRCHRETHHPDMYNKPDAVVHINIELNMTGEKKTRFVDNFTRTVWIPHKFNHGEDRTILAFTKDLEIQEQARKAGAQLVALRGVMKRKFPNPKNGTLDVDIPYVVDKFVNGINYSAIKDEYEKDFGIIETAIGTLDMDEKHLEQNFTNLIQDVDKMKPKSSSGFISRCLMLSPPSREKLKIDHSIYIDPDTNDAVLNNEDEEAEAKAMSV
ncbi:hypothetical protein FQR65_LT07049 [Abscondita terminalis]|nr:hypothetical protein FQR65_LT07049 [Abscondita terminalis]